MAMTKHKTPIALARVKAHLTVRDVAELLGTYNGHVARWEAEHTHPNLIYALKLADLYDTTVEELFGHLIDNERN